MVAKVSQLRKKQQPGDKVWTLKDFINDDSIVEPEKLLAPWLCKGDLWMVFSGPGIGKTFFALNVAYAVASGGKFLHWKALAPGKVLYIDGEMSAWDMRNRLSGIVQAAKRDRNGDLSAAMENFRGYAATYQEIGKPFPDLADEDGREMLLELAHGADLLVIDNLTTTMRGADPDKAMDWTPMQDALVEMRKQNTAVLLVHHTNKSGDQTGTKAKEAILNGMMKLERPTHYSPAEGAKFHISWGKARGLSGVDTVPVRAHLIQDEDDLPKWDFKVMDEQKVHELMRLAQSGSYASQKELAEAMKVSPGRISQLKDSAINDYQLFTARQFMYWLKAAGELNAIEKMEGASYF